MEPNEDVLPDFKELETKLGRKVPDSLVRSLVEGKQEERDRSAAPRPGKQQESADLKRLESKVSFLKQEMAHLRAIDVKLMQQLLSINEGIESIRWVLEEEKAGAASQDGSLAGSLYSLSDSQDGAASSSSLRGSLGSLTGDGGDSDGLDGLSVGSYLDTLGEDLPEQPSPPPSPFPGRPDPPPSLGDKQVIGGGSAAAFAKAHKLRVEPDEYYCFG